MKYTIETTETGCIETLELDNGKKYVKRSTRTRYGSKTKDEDFAEQLEFDGIHDEELLEIVSETFDGCIDLDFMKIAELIKG